VILKLLLIFLSNARQRLREGMVRIKLTRRNGEVRTRCRRGSWLSSAGQTHIHSHLQTDAHKPKRTRFRHYKS